MFLCTVPSNADFCTWISGCSPYFIVIIVKYFLSQYFVKYCSPSSSDWITKSSSAYWLGSRGEGRIPCLEGEKAGLPVGSGVAIRMKEEAGGDQDGR